MNYDSKPQPPPVRTETPEVWPAIIRTLKENDPSPANERLIAACQARDAFGRQKYGVGLQVENGRDPLTDALDEALDAMAYTYQHKERTGTLSAASLYLQATRLAFAIVDEVVGAKADDAA